MFQRLARTLMITALAGSLAHVAAAPALAGPFPDKALETAVRALIFDKKDPNTELTDDDLKKVFVLEARGKGIKDLTGLEKCVNLALINLARNEVSDVTPLKGLTNLQSLDLAENKVADLAPLAGLTALQFLELSDNQVTSVQPLTGLTKLSALYMSGNKVSDLAPLATLTKLSSLDLAGNQVADLAPLAHVTGLSLLKLSGNMVQDLTPLAKQTQLKMLFLERNKITDLAPLVAAVKADAEGEKRFAPFLRLYLAENPLSEVAQKEQLPALKSAGVRLETVPAS